MKKLIASVVTSLIFLGVILTISLTIYFLSYDYSTALKDNVSSAFNFAFGEYGEPFITWKSYTVLQYLWTDIGVTAGLVIAFSLLGFTVGASFKNVYVASFATVMSCGLQFIVSPLFPLASTMHSLVNLTPVMLVVNCGKWFTDGGMVTIWANFEYMGLVTSLATLIVTSIIAMMIFKGKELL